MKMLVKIELAITILFLTKTNLEAEGILKECILDTKYFN